MSDITPEQIAAALTGGSDVNEVLNGWVDVSAEGNVAHVTYTPVKATQWSSGPDRENAKHFRAPVVEGTESPIVLERPAEPGLCWDEDGGDLILPIESGLRMWPPSSDWFDMTPAEARELAAHLAAMADDWETDQKTGLWPGQDEQPPAEAAQAEQNGGQS